MLDTRRTITGIVVHRRMSRIARTRLSPQMSRPVFRDDGRMQKAYGDDTGGKALQVAHVFAVAVADKDLVAGDFDDLGRIGHRAPPAGSADL
jgi:hypothetical protein